MIRGSLAPRARAASTNSRSLKLTAPCRARFGPTPIQPTQRQQHDHEPDRAELTEEPVSQVQLRRTGCASRAAATRIGKARNRSVIRISTSSMPARRGSRRWRRRSCRCRPRDGDGDADEQRHPTAPDDAGVEVAADVVGAEPGLGARRRVDARDRAVEAIASAARSRAYRAVTGEDHRQRHQHEDDERRHRQLVTQEPAQRQLRRRLRHRRRGPRTRRAAAGATAASARSHCALDGSVCDRWRSISQGGSSGRARRRATSASRLKHDHAR